MVTRKCQSELDHKVLVNVNSYRRSFLPNDCELDFVHCHSLSTAKQKIQLHVKNALVSYLDILYHHFTKAPVYGQITGVLLHLIKLMSKKCSACG